MSAPNIAKAISKGFSYCYYRKNRFQDDKDNENINFQFAKANVKNTFSICSIQY